MLLQLSLSSCLLLSAISYAAVTPPTRFDVVSDVIRQEQPDSAEVVQSLSDTTFELVDGPPSCPRKVQHGEFVPDDHPNVYASILFSEITVSLPSGDSTCGDGTGTEFLSVGTSRLLDGQPGVIAIPEGVYLYGLDGMPRACNLNGLDTDTKLAYLFTKDISVFLPSLKANGYFESLNIGEEDMDPERLWMLSFPTDGSGLLCLFMETEQFVEPTSTPVPTPEPEVEEEEIVEMAAEEQPDEDRPPPVFGSPNSASEVENDRACFPGSGQVRLQDGRMKAMEDLQVGDHVMVKCGVFSQVFMFTHKYDEGLYRFLRFGLESGDEMTVTGGHYMYVNGEFASAATAVVGDEVELGDGSRSRIAWIGEVVSKGLFNPQTVHGDIVVDNVRASTYTTAIEAPTAHALLTPLRAVFFGASISTSVFDNGMDRLAGIGGDGVFGS